MKDLPPGGIVKLKMFNLLPHSLELEGRFSSLSPFTFVVTVYQGNDVCSIEGK